MPVDSLLLQGINTPQRSHSSISSLSLGLPLGCFLMPLPKTFSLRDMKNRLEHSVALTILFVWYTGAWGDSFLSKCCLGECGAGGREVEYKTEIEVRVLTECKLGIAKGQGQLICVQSPGLSPQPKGPLRPVFFLMI